MGRFSRRRAEKRRPVYANEPACRRQEESRFRALIEALPVAILVFSKSEQKVEYLNHRFAELIGYTLADVRCLEDWWALAFPDEAWRRQVGAACGGALRQGEADNDDIQSGETTVRCKDGSSRYVECIHSSIAERRLFAFVDLTSRQRAVEWLRRSAAEIEDLYNRAPCGYHSLDQDGTIVRINDTELSWLGYRREEVTGKMRWPDLLTPASAQVFAENFPRFIERGAVSDLELEAVRRDGSILPFVLSATAIKDNDGTYVMSRSTVHDVTYRREAQAAVAASEKKYRALAENLEEGIWQLDAEEITRYVNPRMAHLLGYTPQEMSGKRLSTFMDECAREAVKRSLNGRGQGVKGAQDVELLRKDGAIIYAHVESAPLYGDGGHYAGMLAAVTDITERRRAEQELARSRSSLAEAQRIAHLGDCELDLTDHGMRCSDEVYRICGIDPQEVRLTFESFLDRIHPEDREAWRRCVTAPANEGALSGIEYRIVRSGGDVRYVQGRCEAACDATGVPVKRILTLQDITERKQAELALEETSARLRRLAVHIASVREKEGARIAREVHDSLGSTLTMLKLGLNMLLEKVEDPALRQDIEPLLPLVETSIQTARRISSDLRPDMLDKLGLVATVRWHAREFGRTTGIQTELRLPAAIGLSPERSTALYRIIQEALTNVARHAVASRVAIVAYQKVGDLIVEIADNGRGIAESDLAKRDSFGLLGMQERCRFLGGEVAVRATPGGGTTLTLRVPLDAWCNVGPT